MTESPLLRTCSKQYGNQCHEATTHQSSNPVYPSMNVLIQMFPITNPDNPNHPDNPIHPNIPNDPYTLNTLIPSTPPHLPHSKPHETQETPRRAPAASASASALSASMENSLEGSMASPQVSGVDQVREVPRAPLTSQAPY